MNKKIALLRGINVGGKRKVLMKDLQELFAELGFYDIVTYIQSGNVIFNSSSQLSEIEIAAKIENGITNKYNFSVPVIIVSAKRLERTIKNNPFILDDDTDVSRLALTFLKGKPKTENRIEAESYVFKPDKFNIIDRDVYIYFEGKSHLSKMTNNFFENKLKVSATTRNWKTVMKLSELSRVC